MADVIQFVLFDRAHFAAASHPTQRPSLQAWSGLPANRPVGIQNRTPYSGHVCGHLVLAMSLFFHRKNSLFIRTGRAWHLMHSCNHSDPNPSKDALAIDTKTTKLGTWCSPVECSLAEHQLYCCPTTAFLAAKKLLRETRRVQSSERKSAPCIVFRCSSIPVFGAADHDA